MSAEQFHPAIKAWFENNFDSATPCQKQAWPSIVRGQHTLIAAPTGSGKTLAAFLAGIDRLVRRGIESGLNDETHILYISPLKALSNDVHRNLEQPLQGIGKLLVEQGHPEVGIRSMVRTGDTPASQRTAMAKKPPHILVTTPESVYILLTSDSGRRMLKTVSTVIVDEIHAVANSKRGVHLALSLERLESLTQSSFTRIGLSATQRPIQSVARLLLGSERPLNQCSIIDTGHQRRLDLALELPTSPLEALLSGQSAGEIYDRMTQLIQQHNTTLVFVNTRRMAERVARALSERMDPDSVTSHHGSLAREQRLAAEQRLKSGDLRALVATASLELGIDIGDVDLVCQIGTTGSISTLLQRVGRSGHSTTGIPKGRLFPTSRDELIECIAMLDAIKRGELDRLCIRGGTLDVLAQQLVAMVSCEEWDEPALYRRIKQASPYSDLTPEDFRQTLGMLAQGFNTRQGPRSAYLHRDTIHAKLRARKGARLTAVTCGGAIPDNADYRVIADPEGQFIGTVNEDFAMESLTGDIFQLGNNSWRVRRMEAGELHVEDAGDLPPSIPFWFGEAPGRTEELSQSVSRLREAIAGRCDASESSRLQAARWLQQCYTLSEVAAQQAVNYIAAAQATLGVIPTLNTLVLERFFDESGGMQLILHSPWGSAINRAWGLALRKRFCRRFNFELQAAAIENAIILSLGTSQSFELESVSRFLHSESVRDLLIQALLDAPMFNVRWRWNCTCALAIKRFQGGKKTPPYLVRMQSEDLITSVFPEQLACQENLSGDREIPDHPLVRQTIDDCLSEAMDIDGLIAVLKAIESGNIRVIARDLVEPSPLAAEILNATNYAFLDGAPAEERRTRAVQSRRWLDPESASDLGKLDPAAIARVRDEVWPRVDNADELHDALSSLALIVEGEDNSAPWAPFMHLLIEQKRALRVVLPNAARVFWIATERLPEFVAAYPGLVTDPALYPGVEINQRSDRESALTAIVRARLEHSGPIQTTTLSGILQIDATEIERCLTNLESEGFLLRGHFTPDCAQREWCERRLLARIHRYTIKRLRKQIEPVSAMVFYRFLFQWQHLVPEYQMQGNEACAAIVRQLEGYEAAAGVWESEILPARIVAYEPEGLDHLCLSGNYFWSRVSASGFGNTTLKSSPLGFFSRGQQPLWRSLRPDPASVELSVTASDVAHLLAEYGASFHQELVTESTLLPSQLENALAELVAKGLVTSDRFSGLRALLIPEQKRKGRLAKLFGMQDAGRWALIEPAAFRQAGRTTDQNARTRGGHSRCEMLESFILILLRRYGILFRALLTRESLAPPWQDLVPILRRMEARGELRGGRFVAGQYGEQFALPEAIESLRKFRKNPEIPGQVTINATDPLNLVGVITTGAKINAQPHIRILLQNGTALAFRSGKQTQFLEKVEPEDQWEISQKLVRTARPFANST